MITSLLLCTALSGPKWFGPVTVSHQLATVGNPFSPNENDVRVVFTHAGHRYERLAYYGHGQWHAVLSAPEGGVFTTQFVVNGKPDSHSAGRVNLKPATDSEFVLKTGTRFKLSSGKPYIPYGYNLAWQYGGAASYATQLADMHKAGLTWTRIWSNKWDGKGPFIPQDSRVKLKEGWMNEPAFDRWDGIVRECEKDDLKFQFVLFHHGLFSTTTDPNWGENPWNVTNGGFLADPTDFFINPKAKKLTKAWLRYAIARWGHSTSIMAWELFNEVQWVDAAKLHPDRVGDVIAWHKEMGAYMRSLDPYHHLVTSSSSEELTPKVFETMDYMQPHIYPSNIYTAILGFPPTPDKPSFFGEFGIHDVTVTEKLAKRGLRDGFWAGLLSGQAGPSQYWYWDEAYKFHLHEEFARGSRILSRCGFAENPTANPAPIEVMGAAKSDWVGQPGLGWGTTQKFVFNLPAEGVAGTLRGLSSYIQSGKSHNRNLMREPIRFRFSLGKPGTAVVRISQVAKWGGSVEISLNGKMVATKSWPAGTGDQNVDATFPIPVSAGKNEIKIDDQGVDWVKLQSITLPGLGSGVMAASLRSDRYALMRIQWLAGIGSSTKSISLPNQPDGTYQMRQFNIETGAEKDSKVQIQSGRITPYHPFAPDEGVALFRVRT